MTAPQIIMAAILAIEFIYLVSMENRRQAVANGISVAVMQGLIYWGGFWS